MSSADVWVCSTASVTGSSGLSHLGARGGILDTHIDEAPVLGHPCSRGTMSLGEAALTTGRFHRGGCSPELPASGHLGDRWTGQSQKGTPRGEPVVSYHSASTWHPRSRGNALNARCQKWDFILAFHLPS